MGSALQTAFNPRRSCPAPCRHQCAGGSRNSGAHRAGRSRWRRCRQSPRRRPGTGPCSRSCGCRPCRRRRKESRTVRAAAGPAAAGCRQRPGSRRRALRGRPRLLQGWWLQQVRPPYRRGGGGRRGGGALLQAASSAVRTRLVKRRRRMTIPDRSGQAASIRIGDAGGVSAWLRPRRRRLHCLRPRPPHHPRPDRRAATAPVRTPATPRHAGAVRWCGSCGWPRRCCDPPW